MDELELFLRYIGPLLPHIEKYGEAAWDKIRENLTDQLTEHVTQQGWMLAKKAWTVLRGKISPDTAADLAREPDNTLAIEAAGKQLADAGSRDPDFASFLRELISEARSTGILLAAEDSRIAGRDYFESHEVHHHYHNQLQSSQSISDLWRAQAHKALKEKEDMQKVRWQLTIEAAPEDIDPKIVTIMNDVLRDISGDANLSITRIFVGSIIVELETSDKGGSLIGKKISDGSFSKLLGYPVISITRVDQKESNVQAPLSGPQRRFARSSYYEDDMRHGKIDRKKVGYRVAVVGATGSVGREMLKTLAEREFPVDQVVALASARSVGNEVSFGENETLKINHLADFDFRGIDIVLSSPGAKVSATFAPKAAAAGAVVIDNTSYFRMDPDVPLVVPEVNPQAIAGYRKKGIISNPSCSTIQMVVALKPLHDLAVVRRVVVSTYQSVSGAGKEAMDELFKQTRGIYINEPAHQYQNKFTKQIAFNVIPHIDVFMDDGSTKEEWKMAVETRKIMGADIQVTATCVRVPVFVGHAEAVTVEFEGPISVDEAHVALQNAPGVTVVDHRADEGYVTPVECAGEDPVYVSRVRKDPTVKNGLQFWIVADNLRKGAALNAIQIAEELVRVYMLAAA